MLRRGQLKKTDNDNDSSVRSFQDSQGNEIDVSELNDSNSYDEQITFMNYTHRYCVCIIDIVNSTMNTREIIGSEKIRGYYSIFLNTMATIIKDHNGKVIKNSGDNLLYYFPKTVDASNELAFQDVIDCGLALIATNSTLDANLSKYGLPSINYRISGNYGKVELATSTNSNNVDLFGPTVNICSKINHLALPNGMVIYKDLYDIISKTSYFKDYRFKEISEIYDGDGYSKNSWPVYSVHPVSDPIEQLEINDKKRRKHTEQEKIKQNQDNSSFNILLVDDDSDILFTFTTIIEGEGYNLASYSEPYKALNHFSQMSPYYYDLVVMDIRMPGLNGIQLYSKIKVMNPEIKVLFLSALDAVDELLSIFPDIKASEIIRKPVEPKALLSKIKTILR
jgi:CheY-like chemotaxis protein